MKLLKHKPAWVQQQQDIMAWGASHQYPQLVLSADEYVKHGEQHWRRMVRYEKRRILAWKRIRQWQEYMQRAS
jgi:hypothetical protein